MNFLTFMEVSTREDVTTEKPVAFITNLTLRGAIEHLKLYEDAYNQKWGIIPYKIKHRLIAVEGMNDSATDLAPVMAMVEVRRIEALPTTPGEIK